MIQKSYDKNASARLELPATRKWLELQNIFNFVVVSKLVSSASYVNIHTCRYIHTYSTYIQYEKTGETSTV